MHKFISEKKYTENCLWFGIDGFMSLLQRHKNSEKETKYYP